jgi:hypothetical protein
MPFLQSSGAISINDIRTMFGGGTPASITNYYRGGANIPATGSSVREPATGSSHGGYISNLEWLEQNPIGVSVYWYSSSPVATTTVGATSVTVGNTTYYRAEYVLATGSYGITTTSYRVYRIVIPQINTGIPSSGAISLSQFYGAEKP